MSWGGSLALALYRRNPGAAASLILADTYAGWKGSLPEAVCAERLEMALRTSTMSPRELVSDVRDVLVHTQVPTLLLWGAADERSPLSIADGMRDAIPGARLAVIPDAGHDRTMEQPDRFSAEVRGFCRSASHSRPT